MTQGLKPMPTSLPPLQMSGAFADLPQSSKPQLTGMAAMPTHTSDAAVTEDQKSKRPSMPTLPSFPTAGSTIAFPPVAVAQSAVSPPQNQVVVPMFSTPRIPEAKPAPTIPATAPIATPMAIAPPLRTTTENETPPVERKLPPLEREDARVDYTDAELFDCFRPIVSDAVHRSLFQPEGGMDSYFEPMLRGTIRRALAEHSPGQAPFIEPGFLDRMAWKLHALFSSRSYEEIFFEKTRRFRVEEVYLLDKHHLGLISYASADPARHASAKRVSSTARRLADGALDKEGTIRLFFDLPEGRHAVVREGKSSLLVAVIIGAPNEALRVDLDYTLKRVEDRFAARFGEYDAPLLLGIQPHLEDCLLILSPSAKVS